MVEHFQNASRLTAQNIAAVEVSARKQMEMQKLNAPHAQKNSD